MDKYFNDISIVFGLVGGFICSFLGGWDMLLKSIVILMVLDYVTGLLKGIYNKELSSEIGFKGLIRKIKLDDGNDRFDKTLCLHNHLKCTTCGKAIDITPKLNSKKIKEIKRKTGFKITDSSFNINGICEKCKKERNY